MDSFRFVKNTNYIIGKLHSKEEKTMMSTTERRLAEKSWIESISVAKEFDGQRTVCLWVGLSMLVYAGVSKLCSVLLFKNADYIAKQLDNE